MDSIREYRFILTLTAIIFLSGCSSGPAIKYSAEIPRTSVASFYHEAPWTNSNPTNIKAIAYAAVDFTQGLANISSAYSRQLQINNLAQQQLLNNPSAYQSRAEKIRECINVGGGVQGGMTCEKIGLADYQEHFVNQPTTNIMDEIDVDAPDWMIEIGWTQMQRPLFTEQELAEIATGVAGIVQENNRMGRALPR